MGLMTATDNDAGAGAQVACVRQFAAGIPAKMNAVIESLDRAVSPADFDRSLGDLIPELLSGQQVPCDTIHRFAPGVYIRELTVPSGTLLVGHYQRAEHLNVMLRGSVIMLTPDGTKEVEAPLTYVGQPGRKVGIITETMTWLNIYPNPDDERDIDKLEARWLLKVPAFFDAERGLVEQKRVDDIEDYTRALEELGITDELVRAQSRIEDDLVEFPGSAQRVKVGLSSIEGLGLMAATFFDADELICQARVGGKRTPAGRYINHAKDPNARMVVTESGDINVVAVRDICGQRGGFDGDEITVDYRLVNPLRKEK